MYRTILSGGFWTDFYKLTIVLMCVEVLGIAQYNPQDTYSVKVLVQEPSA